MRLILLIYFFIILPVKAAPTHFGASKEILKGSIYPFKGQTFYCGCEYQKNSIKSESCKLMLKKSHKRARRLEWEHVVPVSAFGHSFKEYREAKKLCPAKGKKSLSPRKCATKLNPKFAAMAGDLHNLVPVVGAINALRSNFSFTELGAEAQKLCDKGFLLLGRKVSPPQELKGDVARIYLYMDTTYPGTGIISEKNRKLFDSWNKLDPVSKYECELDSLKAKFQGVNNPFIASQCTQFSKANK